MYMHVCVYVASNLSLGSFFENKTVPSRGGGSATSQNTKANGGGI